MHLELVRAARVFIDLRTAGLLQGFGHDPTLTAESEPFSVDLGEGEAEAAVEARFRVDAIEPPAHLTAADRSKMRDNVLGPEVLDALRFPTIDLRARYRGSLDGGRLAGELVVRGVARTLAMPVAVSREGDYRVAAGFWEGALTDLGIKPFRALLGTLRLQDWIRLRFEATFAAR
jgi:hypothetical protein